MSQKIFDNDLAVIYKIKVTLNKLQNKYGNNSRLLFTDTDILCDI